MTSMTPMADLLPAYDVVVLGGGLAGLTLALQILQRRPETRVLVIEKQAHPVNEAAHKVGESSVEIGAHYFTRVLGQLDHFRTSQLPKLGLRYFFDADDPNDITTRTELGGNTFFPTESFQIDRGRFENHLGDEALKAGAHFVHGASVREVNLGTRGATHTVQFIGPEAVDGALTQVESRWVVDASGRASILKRKLGLAKKNGHDANSTWWRYDRRLKVDDFTADEAWTGRTGGKRQRWLSTVHFCGAGYWLWFIPLSSGSHSIGIVVDGKIHPFNTISTYEKSMAWVRKFEPQAAAHIDAAIADGAGLQDFLALKDFSYSCTQLYDSDRWALTGEAGAFLDPFYSPGSDYIGISNTFVTDLVLRDLAGERIGARASVYNRIFFNFYENHLSLYEGQMHMNGDAKVMTLKIIWDFAYYWVMPAAFFFSDRLTDMMMFAERKEALDRTGDLNRAVQILFRDWHAAGIKTAPVFVNMAGIEYMRELNRGLKDELTREAFNDRLTVQLATLDQLAAELFGEARQDVPGIQSPMLEALPTTEVTLLATVFPVLQPRAAAPSTP